MELLCFSFLHSSVHFDKGTSRSLGGVSLGGTSVILRVNPLVLVSLFKVLGNIISGLHEGVVGVLVGWVVIKVGLSNREGLKLLNSEVVVGDLREGEGLLVDITSMDLYWDVIESSVLSVISDLQGSIKVLLVEGHTELVKGLVHLFSHLVVLSLSLLLLSGDFLLLGELEGLSLLSLLFDKFVLLDLLLLFLEFLLFFDSFLLGKLLLLSSFLLLSSLLFSGFLLSLLGSLLLSSSLGLELFGLNSFLL